MVVINPLRNSLLGLSCRTILTLASLYPNPLAKTLAVWQAEACFCEVGLLQGNGLVFQKERKFSL